MRTDEFIDKLGTYFIHFEIRNRYDLAFEQFVKLVEENRWREVVA